MKLKKVSIHKYKCIQNEQEFDIDDNVTILVGMNESGKTSVLEAIAKSNYFQSDSDFKFNTTHDFPRKEKKALDKSGDNPKAITCEFELDTVLIEQIESDLGIGVFENKLISRSLKYDNKGCYENLRINSAKFVETKLSGLDINDTTLLERIKKIKTLDDFSALMDELDDESFKEKIQTLEKYFQNKWNWSGDPISEYVARVHLSPNIPKCLYYDEYYSLPSRISIEELQEDNLDDQEKKTARALFELADINIDDLIDASDFEDYKAELEATEANISDELFKYWRSNKHLDITFDIDKIEDTDPNSGTRIVEHVLVVRVRNSRSKVSLPLKNRSKGFNWFFSFLVWFKKIQEDNSSNYILLLDEPGLNLHASAQHDLLNFIEDLASDYQVIYTTHSPFMIPSGQFESVRTVVEKHEGSVISESIQEKDPKTLFPLQAALGYDIAQNLFISDKNLLVEGVSDLTYLQVMSSLLQQKGKKFLNEGITIVPTGGLEKVGTFISLMRGNKLKIVCLLDNFRIQKGKAKLDDLVKKKIIQDKNIRFFNEFINGFTVADIEDLFTKDDYLKLYNGSFSEQGDILLEQLNPKTKPIVSQINEFLSISRYNHYRPANYLARSGFSDKDFTSETLNNFENMFEEINRLFQ